jgi:hypothetical protein
VSGPKVRLILKYMREIGVPTTPALLAKRLVHLDLALARSLESLFCAGLCLECIHRPLIGATLGNRGKEDKVYANCSLLATPGDFTTIVNPQGLQALVEKTSDAKDVLDSSVPDISAKSGSPLAKPPSSSMSRRRSSCNMPTLQRILPLNCVPQYTIHDFDGFKIPFPLHPCSTPITPLDQIIHTPRDPPEIQPDARRGSWSPIIATGSSSDSPQVLSPSMSPSVRMAGRLGVRRAMPLTTDRRRLSVVAPPEAPPMHAPRRLSYSKAFGKHNGSSPLSSRKNSATLGEGLACCPENELLASPLAIRSSASAPQRAVLDTCGAEGIFSKDFSFTFSASPQAAKV